MVLTTSVFYFKNKYINIELSISCAIGGAIGGIIGAKLLNKVSDKILKITFIIFIGYIALKFILG